MESTESVNARPTKAKVMRARMAGAANSVERSSSNKSNSRSDQIVEMTQNATLPVTQQRRFTSAKIASRTTGKTHDLDQDYQAALDVITDVQGAVVQEQAFNAGGQRRDVIDWTNYTSREFSTFNHSITIRGFTCRHEAFDTVEQRCVSKQLTNDTGLADPLAGTEIVVDTNGFRVEQPQNADSFNYSPVGLAHGGYDVVPYILFGNSLHDPTSTFQCASRGFESFRRKWFDLAGQYVQ